mgnify:FL=1
MSTAQLEGGAGGFMEANVENEFGQWKNSGLEGKLSPKANTGSASRKVGVIGATVSLD